jgi:hypothetical protein
VTKTQFWEHVHKTRRRDPEAHCERLEERLAKLPPDEILRFERWWWTLAREAYAWNLWGAAYLINGGCSNDGFMDFRDWLILQGRKVFEAAVKNPDTLADVVDPKQDEYEILCSAATRAWFAASGLEPNDAGYQAWHAAWEAKYPRTTYPRPRGRNWNFDSSAQLRKRLPRLAALYLDADE